MIGRLISIEMTVTGKDPKEMTDLVGRTLAQLRVNNAGETPLCRERPTTTIEHVTTGARVVTKVTTLNLDTTK